MAFKCHLNNQATCYHYYTWMRNWHHLHALTTIYLLHFCSNGSSVHGILQARKLEWLAICFSRGSFQPRDWAHVSHIAGRFFTFWAAREALLMTQLKLKNLSNMLFFFFFTANVFNFKCNFSVQQRKDVFQEILLSLKKICANEADQYFCMTRVPPI